MAFANSINISSGQILFGDPTKPWSRLNLPELPSTNLVLTTVGSNDDATFQRLVLTNKINYESFEPSNSYSNLEKTLIVDLYGKVNYKTLHVGFVSTNSASFNNEISSFTSSNIGGTNIQDINSARPDTITNALAKLDNWLKVAFLTQPPTVSTAKIIESSVYASVRWSTFQVYNILNATMPNVTSIVFIIGNADGDNLTFELTDKQYFPVLNYRDGISPVLNPLVQIRIFRDFFPVIGNVSYTKAQLEANNGCFTLINNSGNYALSSSGRVFTVENTNGINTYTTLNIFLPNISKNTNIPVNIIYTNNTMDTPNVATFSTLINTINMPSAPNFSTTTFNSNSIRYEIQPPQFCDINNQLIEKYNSTYGILIQWTQWKTVKDETSGFLYGARNLQDITSTYSSFVNPISTSVTAYNSTLSIPINEFIPGALWNTNINTTNLGGVVGSYGISQSTQTDFISTNISTLANKTLYTNSDFVKQNTFRPNISSGVWSIGTQLPCDVAFLSSPARVSILSPEVQLNDSTYPGDRNSILINMYYENLSASLELIANPITNDYNLNSTYTNDDIAAIVTDTNITYGHLFYKTVLNALPFISTSESYISTQIQLSLENTFIQNGLESTQTVSSAVYNLIAEPIASFQYIEANYTSTVTSTSYTSGILSPALNAALIYNGLVTNPFVNITNSTFGNARFYYNNNLLTSTNHTSNIYIYSNINQLNTVPLPQNTPLTYSNLTVPVGLVYQNVNNPYPWKIETTLISPYNDSSTIIISIDSNLYVDTISLNSKLSISSQHVLSMLPRTDISTTVNDIKDGFLTSSNLNIGLQNSYNSFIHLTSSLEIIVSSAIRYDDSISLINTYPSPYTRELIYSGGRWKNPRSLNYSRLSAVQLGISSYTYPDFTNDLENDSNGGYRYGTFLTTHTPISTSFYKYVNITVNNPSIVSTISNLISTNVCFPNRPIDDGFLQYTGCRLQVKLLASYDCGSFQTVETQWINGFKKFDNIFNDSLYDIGGCASVSTSINKITYTVAITPRFYTNIATLIRIGLCSNITTNESNFLSFSDISTEFLKYI
jgi:hypothetical protein